MRFFTVSALILSFAAAARADNTGITVTGSGTTKAPATQVEIGATVTGEAELAADASVKYSDAKRRAVAALEALKNPNLSIESDGFSVNQTADATQQQRMMNGMGADTNAKQKVQITEQLRLQLKDADKLDVKKLLETVLKIVDTGRDSGLSIGGGMTNYQMQMAAQNGRGLTLISFQIPNPAAMREQAYKLAVEDAKAKAARLADLSGVKLGAIQSVHEDSMQTQSNNYWEQMAEAAANHDDKTLNSAVFGDIPLTVRLTVQFEIAK